MGKKNDKKTTTTVEVDRELIVECRKQLRAHYKESLGHNNTFKADAEVVREAMKLLLSKRVAGASKGSLTARVEELERKVMEHDRKLQKQ